MSTKDQACGRPAGILTNDLRAASLEHRLECLLKFESACGFETAGEEQESLFVEFVQLWICQ